MGDSMRALWLVALLLAPCVSAEDSAETDLSMMCLESNEAEGGLIPQAHVGPDTYVYVPVAPLALVSGVASDDATMESDAVGTRGTEIRYTGRCLDIGDAVAYGLLLLE